MTKKVKKVVENKKHWKSYFDHDYIGGFSLTDMDAIVTIQDFKTEIVKNRKTNQQSEKFILYVHDAKEQHKMIVNKTNAGNIERAYGS